MKKTRTFCASIVLILLLTASAFADGQIQIPKAEPTPSEPVVTGSENGGSSSCIDPLSELALGFIQFAQILF